VSLSSIKKQLFQRQISLFKRKNLIALQYEILRSFSLCFIDGTRQGGSAARAPLSVIWEQFNGQDRMLEPESGLTALAGARDI
jgi:hypothetical protein